MRLLSYPDVVHAVRRFAASAELAIASTSKVSKKHAWPHASAGCGSAARLGQNGRQHPPAADLDTDAVLRCNTSHPHMLALSAQGRPAALLVTMHFARTRKRLTAWLGLVAMVLVLFVPMVSQALEAQALQAFEQAAPLCEAKPSAAASTALPIGHEMPAGHHHAACGYCDLLADQVLVPTTLAPMVEPAPIHATAWPAEPGRLAAHQARHTGRPRDSPFLL
ncbi:DUF2946 domain-containing protein [Ralstonia insidiosa]|jgi:hypothetical protein|nr:DUF2946 domain-containing protein [Ralstonia insidiosa]MDE4926187.1 DUF2946 domain-containing protein [Ralstonia insidiosa]